MYCQLEYILLVFETLSIKLEEKKALMCKLYILRIQCQNFSVLVAIIFCHRYRLSFGCNDKLQLGSLVSTFTNARCAIVAAAK